MIFHKNGFTVIVNFFHGVADSIYFRRMDQNDPDHAETLSGYAIQGLLDANGGGKAWIETTDMIKEGDEGWFTRAPHVDDALIAHYWGADRALAIETGAHLGRVYQANAAREVRQLDGF